jgi:general secretion pathway protein A
MYNAFFGLERSPFSMTPDPGFLFLTAKHREALAGLLFAVTGRKGFLVLTGEAGTGKTTLLTRILRSMPETCAQFSFVINPMLTPSEFLEMAMIDFGIDDIPPSKAQRLLKLQNFLLQANREGRTAVLVIDEAHKLTPELLEEIRLLTNFETSDQKLLQILLAGQPELADLLNRADMRQLKQRVAIRLRIDPLREGEVEQYIQARWVRAGARDPLPFTTQAMRVAAKASKGIPRVINSICDSALTNAFGANTKTIDAPHVLDVVTDLQLVPAVNGHGSHSAADPIKRMQPAGVVAVEKPREPVPTTFHSLERYIPKPAKAKRWGLGSGRS